MPVTPARYAEIIGGITLPGAETDAYARMEDALVRAEALCFGECQWRAGSAGATFGAATVTVSAHRDEAEPAELLLPCAEVLTITEAWADTSRAFNASTALDLAGVVAERDRAIRLDGGSWAANRHHNRVTYTCGWAALPVKVEEPIARLAHHLLVGRPGSPVRSQAFAGQSTTVEPQGHPIPSDIVAMLETAGLVWWGGRCG